MQGYPTIIRTGNPDLDRQTVEQHRLHAASQGMVLLVQPLPGGGYQLVAQPAPPPLIPNPVGSTLPSHQGAALAAARPSHQPQAPTSLAGADPGGTLPSRQGNFGYRQAAPVEVILGSGEGYCQSCQRIGPLKRVTFMQNIGAIFLRFPRTISGDLCKFCIDKFFFRYTAITMIGGWWGIISFFYSLVAIPMNVVYWLGSIGMKTPQDDISSLRDRRGRSTVVMALGALSAAMALLTLALGALVFASEKDASALVGLAIAGGVVGLVAAIFLFFGIRGRMRASGGLRRLGAT